MGSFVERTRGSARLSRRRRLQLFPREGGFISPSTPCSRAETHQWGGFGHYSNTDALLLYLSCTATAGSVTLTASYPASFFPQRRYHDNIRGCGASINDVC